ncbi:Polysaccharide monooxygenase Cel61a [Psilocybe cubensis]|uniref:Polysaccharide monooxygenase Cel61a n=2 Tax=Psilocybe cubensis TaxID=181762 RepID=A0ACB8HDK0_PSICU|nr:Polysaccharide monooxygenase Cel61a [Psilocybe cubensis]KAH9485805.1 Polysaccharide monooxygenase Cel61a [Psilocybe cubensis]
MAFTTRLISYTLVALLMLQGHIVQVRGDQGGPPPPDSGDVKGPGGDSGYQGGDGGYGSNQWNPQHGPDGHPGPKPPGSWPPKPDTQVLWGQCGGYYYYGTTKCPPGSYCRWFSDWYSQCNPNDHGAPDDHDHDHDHP